MLQIKILIGFCIFISLPPLVQADAKTDGDKGITYVSQGRLIEGMQLLRKSAEAGYAPAQSTLAFILDKAEQDDEAFILYQKAAESNDAAGLFGLGSMYAKGDGVAKDNNKAGQLIRQSAMLNHVLAMRAYAKALEHENLGFIRNNAEAVKWYQKAAHAGDTVSIRRLTEAYKNGQLGLGIDLKEAVMWEAKLKP